MVRIVRAISHNALAHLSGWAFCSRSHQAYRSSFACSPVADHMSAAGRMHARDYQYCIACAYIPLVAAVQLLQRAPVGVVIGHGTLEDLL